MYGIVHEIVRFDNKYFHNNNNGKKQNSSKVKQTGK